MNCTLIWMNTDMRLNYFKACNYPWWKSVEKYLTATGNPLRHLKISHNYFLVVSRKRYNTNKCILKKYHLTIGFRSSTRCKRSRFVKYILLKIHMFKRKTRFYLNILYIITLSENAIKFMHKQLHKQVI